MSGKELRELIRVAEAAGWRAQHTRGGHIRLLGPDGQLLIVPSTPNRGRRSPANTKALMRRHGIEFGDRPRRRNTGGDRPAVTIQEEAQPT